LKQDNPNGMWELTTYFRPKPGDFPITVIFLDNKGEEITRQKVLNPATVKLQAEPPIGIVPTHEAETTTPDLSEWPDL
jgi:hypothetical protein